MKGFAFVEGYLDHQMESGFQEVNWRPEALFEGNQSIPGQER